MKLSGREVDFKELLKKEYIGSPRGSSLAELKKAAEDYRIYAVAGGNLTSRAIRKSPYPIILHVKSSGKATGYDHFELFLGVEDNKAKLFDPPAPIRLVPFYELAPRWDGTGLIVSATPIDTGVIFAASRIRFMIYTGTVAVIVMTVRWGRRRFILTADGMSRRGMFGLSVAKAGILAVISLMCGMVYHFANDEGFLAHANATSSVEKAHLANFIPKVDREQVSKLLGTGTVFVDARLTKDFEGGHLKGAINVPVDCNDMQCRRALSNVAKDADIVLYCQSEGCKFAETVAVRLMAEGFSNLSLFRGGWQEWQTKNN
jgi:rhodanese-related sulfurtransferase